MGLVPGIPDDLVLPYLRKNEPEPRPTVDDRPPMEQQDPPPVTVGDARLYPGLSDVLARNSLGLPGGSGPGAMVSPTPTANVHPASTGKPVVAVGRATGQPVPYGVTQTPAGEPVPATPAQAFVHPSPDQPAPVEGAVTSPTQIDPNALPKEQPPGPMSYEQKLAALETQKLQAQQAGDITAVSQVEEAQRFLAQQERDRRVGAAQAGYDAQMKHELAAQQEQQQKLMADVQAHMAQVDAASKQLLAASPDPSKVWGAPGTMRNALTTAMAAGLIGGPAVASMMDLSVRQAMQQQYADFDREKLGLGLAQEGVNARVGLMNQSTLAFQARQKAMAEALKEQVQNIAKAIPDEVIKANLMQGSAAFMEKQLDDAAKNALERARIAKLQGTGGGGGGVGAVNPTYPGGKGGSLVLSDGSTIELPDSAAYKFATGIGDPLTGASLMSADQWDPKHTTEVKQKLAEELKQNQVLNNHMAQWSDLMRRAKEEYTTKGRISDSLKSTLDRELHFWHDAVITPELASKMFGGRKPSKGEIDRIVDTIPDAEGVITKVFAKGDYSPLEFMDAIQGMNERDVAATLNVHRIDPGPVIRNIRSHYFSKSDLQPPSTTGSDDVRRAQAALAADPDNRDLQRNLEKAKDKADDEAKAETKRADTAAKSLGQFKDLTPVIQEGTGTHGDYVPYTGAPGQKVQVPGNIIADKGASTEERSRSREAADAFRTYAAAKAKADKSDRDEDKVAAVRAYEVYRKAKKALQDAKDDRMIKEDKASGGYGL